jgi:hypothetical protein
VRRRSLTNSNKHEDPALREAYRQTNPDDELLRYWPTQGAEALVQFQGEGYWLSKRHTEACDIHHIGKGQAQRADVWSNLVAVCRTTHLWLETFVADGMALCMAAKIAKGEWDDGEMRDVLGLWRPGASVAEFIGRKGFKFAWIAYIHERNREWERQRLKETA